MGDLSSATKSGQIRRESSPLVAGDGVPAGAGDPGRVGRADRARGESEAGRRREADAEPLGVVPVCELLVEFALASARLVPRRRHHSYFPGRGPLQPPVGIIAAQALEHPVLFVNNCRGMEYRQPVVEWSLAPWYVSVCDAGAG